MSEFKYNVTVDADSNEEAKIFLSAAIKILKTAKQQISAKEFLEFANKLEKQPHMVKIAVKIL